MRIAFVGKGGSGKSTLAASMSAYIAKNTDSPVLVFDADLNIHVPELLGFKELPYEKHLSHPNVSGDIKKWLIGHNDYQDLGVFRKSTPPTRKSNILKIADILNTPLISYCEHHNNLFTFAVGTYQNEDVGASCYHNNLAILENILCHLDDSGGYVVVDMVAGVDAFAGTLHAQFDLTCLVVEPTKRSIEVYEKYSSLAKESGVADGVFVIANKIRDDVDVDFINNHIPKDKIIGYFNDDQHIRSVDQSEEPIDTDRLNAVNKNLLVLIKNKLESLPDSRNSRLRKIWELHKKYVGQSFILARFGDLTGQIDADFKFEEYGQ